MKTLKLTDDELGVLDTYLDFAVEDLIEVLGDASEEDNPGHTRDLTIARDLLRRVRRLLAQEGNTK